jgi:hypothetical protein
VVKTDRELPKADQVVKTLFGHFCKCCELGKEGCLRLGEAEVIFCPVFKAVSELCPDNRFVLHIIGKYMRCPKCNAVGMAPPTSSFNAPVQPVLMCLNCAAPLWKGRYGMLVERLEDINRSFACKIVDEDGVLRLREIVDDAWLESIYGSAERSCGRNGNSS